MDNADDNTIPPKPVRRFFRPAHDSTRLSRDAAAREGAAIRLAINTLGSSHARLFLNEPNDALEGRPLSIAAQSASGFRLVCDAIIERASASTLAKQATR